MGRNTVATPLVATSLKLHNFIFGQGYAYPLDITIQHSKVSVKVDNVFQLKYIPFFTALILFTFLIGFNSCLFVLSLKLFRPKTPISVVAIIFSVLFGSCSFVEWASYIVYSRAKEIEVLLNQLFDIERNCKLKLKILLLKYLANLVV